MVGETVQAKVNRKSINLVVTQTFAPSAAMQAAKPGIVTTIIAEGRTSKLAICKMADVFKNGSVVWY